MALLRDTRTAPPDGWFYVQLETECTLRSDSPQGLVREIAAHRKHKGLEPVDAESIWLDVQRQVCSGLDTEHCRPEPGENFKPVRNLMRALSLSKIAAFTEGLVEFLKGGGHFCAIEEATARAKICRGCRFNMTPHSCACEPFYRMLALLIPKDRQHKGLHVCGACGCALQAKVNLPRAAIDASNEHRDLNFPTFCWQRPAEEAP